MKFLIDECLSPHLVAMARNLGFPESTHVNWIGLRSQPDWKLVQRAVNDGYVLVTNNTTDFTALIKRQSGHPGLVCINIAHSLMGLAVQQQLFEFTIRRIANEDLAGQIVETTLTTQRQIRLDRYYPEAG